MDMMDGMMGMSLFFARAFGLYFLAVGIALLFDPERFRDLYRKLMGEESMLLMGGVISLLFGSFVVASHNIWMMDWPLLITLIGWWGFIKGSLLIAYPGAMECFKPMLEARDVVYRIAGMSWVVIGLFFIYEGFMS